MARSAVVRALANLSWMRLGETRSVDLDAEPEWVRRAAKGLVAIDHVDQPPPEPAAREPAVAHPAPGPSEQPTAGASVGTVGAVLNRVDTADDPVAEAEAALAQEEAKEHPRSTLVNELRRRLADDGYDDEGT